MAINLTTFQSTLQSRLNNTSADAKELLLLGKAVEASRESNGVSDIEQATTDGVATVGAATTNTVSATNHQKVEQLANTYGNTGGGASYRSSFFIGKDGTLYGFGNNNSEHQGNLNIGSVGYVHPIAFKQTYSNDGRKFIKLENSYYTICALDDAGDMYMWGYNGHGECGQGHTSNLSSATRVKLPSSINIKDFCFSKSGNNNNAQTVLALDTNGDVWSWGYNGHGQCGRNGTSTNSTTYTPQKIANLDSVTIERVYNVNGRGAGSAAAIDSAGKVYMWGYNGYGQCGANHTSSVTVPTDVTPSLNSGEKIVHVQLHGHNYNSTQIVSNHGRSWGAGYNGHGQLGVGHTSQRNYFQLSAWWTGANDDRRVKIDETGNGGNYGEDIRAYFWGAVDYHGHRMAISKSNKLYGWGYNGNAELVSGNSTYTYSGNPHHTHSGSNMKLVNTGNSGLSYSASILLFTDGTVKVGGYNGNGQLCRNSEAEYDGVAENWEVPNFPQGVQGNIKVARSAGTGNQNVMEVLLHDGTYYIAGYSSDYSQGTTQNSRTRTLHRPIWG